MVGAHAGLPARHRAHGLRRRAHRRVPHEETHVLHPDHEETTGTDRTVSHVVGFRRKLLVLCDVLCIVYMHFYYHVGFSLLAFYVMHWHCIAAVILARSPL